MPKPMGHQNIVRTFGDQDATPSVADQYPVYQTSNSQATTITGFDNVQAGQRFYVYFGDGNTTVDFTGTNLKGNAGADKAMAEGDHMSCFSPDGTVICCNVEDGTT